MAGAAPAATGYGLGLSLLEAGLCLAPSGLVMMALSPLSARMSARWGPKVALMAGAGIMAFGYGIGLLLMSAAWQVVITVVLAQMVIGSGPVAALPSLAGLRTGFVVAAAAALAGLLVAAFIPARRITRATAVAIHPEDSGETMTTTTKP
ncbi:hypothetical protein [Microtetraspora sp. NBRC 13810]|uniref:hypothetical protein n=1 Tax=Microtetraspora sp. NBRC 13810 TaxID=3030990 RepID=UPI0025522054|nr:hypothetical protein [Microtetraspora sp. NBRC 13810]